MIGQANPFIACKSGLAVASMVEGTLKAIVADYIEVLITVSEYAALPTADYAI